LEGFEPSGARDVIWLGNSRKNLKEFPKEVQKGLGGEIQKMQFGGMPEDAKPFNATGSGVFEIAIEYDTNAYRVVVAVKLGDKIYVLHAFQKKSTKGIATQKKDVDLIKERYRQAQRLSKS